jgi:2-iminobutanoate/2-iminopropanoate deaminase
MKKTIIATKDAPGAVGPYSQGVIVGDFVFTAGQIAISPHTGSIVEGSIVEQTHQVMRNLQAILESAGTSLDGVVKTTVFLQNMGDFADMNGVYGEYFTGEPPARSTIEVGKLPLGVLVEIEAVAVRSEK